MSNFLIRWFETYRCFCSDFSVDGIRPASNSAAISSSDSVESTSNFDAVSSTSD